LRVRDRSSPSCEQPNGCGKANTPSTPAGRVPCARSAILRAARATQPTVGITQISFRVPTRPSARSTHRRSHRADARVPARNCRRKSRSFPRARARCERCGCGHARREQWPPRPCRSSSRISTPRRPAHVRPGRACGHRARPAAR
jgi:hypothetical protein